ncbi:MAG: SMI1/KNR4 family protein [Bacteroidota bacterium]
MKNITILTSSPPATAATLSAFEAKHNIQLPTAYKKFLMEMNPRTIKEQVFQKEHREFWIHRFFAFDKGYELSFQSTYQAMEAHFENKYIAFALDPGSWMFVISIKKEDYGQVYFCRMDEELEEALTFLADDFESFLEGLFIFAR